MPDGQEGNDESSTCLRADFPFPPRNLGRAYFEVTIHEPEGEVESDPPSESNAKARAISIGFSGEFCKQINAHPGWNIWSVGYHGDNGQVYQEAARGTHDTRLTFGTGNTIGCGINYGTSEYFFTLDGNIIGMCAAPRSLKSRPRWSGRNVSLIELSRLLLKQGHIPEAVPLHWPQCRAV